MLSLGLTCCEHLCTILLGMNAIGALPSATPYCGGGIAASGQDTGLLEPQERTLGGAQRTIGLEPMADPPGPTAKPLVHHGKPVWMAEDAMWCGNKGRHILVAVAPRFVTCPRCQAAEAAWREAEA